MEFIKISSSLSLSTNDNDNNNNTSSTNDHTPNESKKSSSSNNNNNTIKRIKNKKFRTSIQCDSAIKGISVHQCDDGRNIIINYNLDGKIQIYDLDISLTIPIKQYVHGEKKEKKISFHGNIDQIERRRERGVIDGTLNCMVTLTHKQIAENNNYDNTLTIVSGSKDGYIRIYHTTINASNYNVTQLDNLWEGPHVVNELGNDKLKGIKSLAIRKMIIEEEITIWIVSGEENGRIIIWDLFGNVQFSFDPVVYSLRSAITSLQICQIYNSKFEKENPTIVFGTKDDILCKISKESAPPQKAQHCNKHQSGITALLVYQPENVDEYFESIIISAGSDSCINIWSYTNLEKLRKLEGHSDTISELCLYSEADPFHPVIVSASADRTIRFWSFRSKDGGNFREMKLHNIEGAKSEPVNCISIVKSNQDFLLISGGDDANIRFTDFSGDELIHSFTANKSNQTRRIGTSLCLTSTEYFQGIQDRNSKRKLIQNESKLEFLCPSVIESDIEKNVVKLTSCLENDLQFKVELEGLDNTDTDAHLQLFNLKSISNNFPSNIIVLTRPPQVTDTIMIEDNSTVARKQSIADKILMKKMTDEDDDIGGSTSHTNPTRERYESFDEHADRKQNYCYLWPISPTLKCSKIELKGHSSVVTSITFCESDITMHNNKKKTIVTAITGSADGAMKRWDIRDGRLLGSVEAHSGTVGVLKSFKQIPKSSNVDIDHDDHDTDHTGNLTDDSKNIITHNNSSSSSSSSNTNMLEFQSYVVSGGKDFLVKIYSANSLENGKHVDVVEEFEHRGEILDISIYNVPGSDVKIITAAADKLIRIISFNSLEVKQMINSNCIGSLTSLAVHSFKLGGGSRQTWIACGTSNGVIKIYDMKTEMLLREMKPPSNKDTKVISEIKLVNLPTKRQFGSVSYRREPIIVSLSSEGQVNIMESYFAYQDGACYPVLTPRMVLQEFKRDQNKKVYAAPEYSDKEDDDRDGLFDEEVKEFEGKVQLSTQKKTIWPRIVNLVDRCGASKVLTTENAILFKAAIDEGRSDFLDIFLRDVPDLVATVYQDDNKLCRSLLGKALHKKDLQSVRVILDCWTSLLSQSAKDHNSLFNHYFFVSNHLHKDCLVELSKSYPNEFHNFILGLKTIPAHPCVSVNCERAVLPPSSCLVEGVNDFAEAKELWIRKLDSKFYIQQQNRKFKNEKKRILLTAPVVATFVPINYAATKEILTCLVKTSITMNNASLFESDIGRFAVQFAWESFGRRLHVRSMIEYFVYLGIFSTSCFLFSSLLHSDSYHYVRLAWAIQATVLLGVLYLFALELFQARGHWYVHFLDVWNLIDVISHATVMTGTLLRVVYLEDTAASRCILSVASLLAWLKVLYFLRGFEGTGHFISIFFVIAYEIRFFLLVLLITLLGFAQSFFMVGLDSVYGMGLGTGLMILFEQMIGVSSVVDFSETVSEQYTSALFVVFSIVVILLLLNLLIAQMNNAFMKVAEKGFAAQFKFERAKIIIEESFLLTRLEKEDPKKFPRTLHVLRRFADVAQEKLFESDEKESDLAFIRRMVESMKDKVDSLEGRIATAEERTMKQVTAFEKHSELMKSYLDQVEEKDRRVLSYFDKKQEAHELLLNRLHRQLIQREDRDRDRDRDRGEMNCNPITMMNINPFSENSNNNNEEDN